jgi:hypothetical protein
MHVVLNQTLSIAQVIERQLVELKATYKEERAESEVRYQKDVREVRTEAESR